MQSEVETKRARHMQMNCIFLVAETPIVNISWMFFKRFNRYVVKSWILLLEEKKINWEERGSQTRLVVPFTKLGHRLSQGVCLMEYASWAMASRQLERNGAQVCL